MSENKPKKAEGKKINNIVFAVVTIFALFAIVLIGPMDCFKYGFFGDDISYDSRSTEDVIGYADLSTEGYVSEFMPVEEYFAGFAVYLTDIDTAGTGRLCLSVKEQDGSVVETIEIEIDTDEKEKWHVAKCREKLEKDQVYVLEIKAEDCDFSPSALLIRQELLDEENITGNLLMKYCYERSVFSVGEKVLISIYIVAAWLMVFSCFVNKASWKRAAKYVSVFIFLTGVLSWNYMFNSMDDNNTGFKDFQEGSETLVTGPVEASEKGIWNGTDYGLGRYYDIYGTHNANTLEFLTNENWTKGYSNTQCAIVLSTSLYSEMVAKVGNTVEFENGDIYKISYVNPGKLYTLIYFDSQDMLSEEKNGSLQDVVFYNTNGKAYAKGYLGEYVRQYGLQGKVFGALAKVIENKQSKHILQLLCSVAVSVVMVAIVFMLLKKYNLLLATCFFITFWLSPWVVNFARNLYWVQFTWFLPMAAGLFCAWKIDSKRCRIFSYAAAFVSILIKSLCGYEYLTTIMLGMIGFLLVDMIMAFAKKDTKKGKMVFKTIVIMGVLALAAFALAMCIHGYIRGQGNIIQGIKTIINEDALRRTVGGDYNISEEKYWESIGASLWESVKQYFHFSTEIITGVSGNLFPVLCLAPAVIFVWEYREKKVNLELLVMYVVFFLTTISWFVLAKSHSYVHTHMNYVLWYFGFVQICFYIILNKIREYFGKDKITRS